VRGLGARRAGSVVTRICACARRSGRRQRHRPWGEAEGSAHALCQIGELPLGNASPTRLSSDARLQARNKIEVISQSASPESSPHSGSDVARSTSSWRQTADLPENSEDDEQCSDDPAEDPRYKGSHHAIGELGFIVRSIPDRRPLPTCASQSPPSSAASQVPQVIPALAIATSKHGRDVCGPCAKQAPMVLGAVVAKDHRRRLNA
jgi:hypothetical protein